MSQKMRVYNQGEYNKILQERENIFHYISEAIEIWYENGPKIQGSNYIYSDKVVILVHIIVSLFRVGLRQMVKFIKGYLQCRKNLQSLAIRKLQKNSILRSMIAELTKTICEITIDSTHL